MSFPDFETTSSALHFDPKVTGETDFGNGMMGFRVEKPQDLSKAPVGYDVLSVQELASLRVEKLRQILQDWAIDLAQESTGNLVQAVRSNAGDILSRLNQNTAPEWIKRWNTRTITWIDENGDAQIVDVSQENFRDPDFIDFSTLSSDSEGGAQLSQPWIPWNIVGTIPKWIYQDKTKSWGWNRALSELMIHPVITALLPDTKLREEYLISLWIVDMLQPFENWSQSLWVQHWLKPWFMRYHALWLKADAFYPPNFLTLYANLLLRKKD